MPGIETLESGVAGLGGNTSTTSHASAGSNGASQPVNKPGSAYPAHTYADGPLMVVPAGLFGNIVGSLAGTIGEVTGDWFGNKELGKTLGEAASPFIKHFTPFQVIAPAAVTPQSAGPEAKAAEGPDEALILVPAGFLTGILGGIGGNLLGGAIGGLFGNKKLGEDIGSGLGGAAGSFLGPFTVVPPDLMPQSSGPEGSQPQEAMIVVPAGFFGNLLGAVSGTFGRLVGGDTGEQVGNVAGQLAQKFLPFQTVPPELAPQSAGPDGSTTSDQLIVLPAGFFGSLVSGFGGVVGGAVGGLFGNAKTGSDVGNIVGQLGSLLPFQAVPPEAVAPQSNQPGAPQPETMMFVPAGLFGNLLGALGSTISNCFPKSTAAQAGGVAGQLAQTYLPFSVLPSTSSGVKG